MNPLTEAGIAAARKRMEICRRELRGATQCDTGDPTVWLRIGEALEQVTYAIAHIDDAMKLETLALAAEHARRAGQ